MADTDQTPDPVAEKLAYLRSRHYRIPDPSIAGNEEEGICASDRHRWPCHASDLLDAVEAVLKLADGWDERSAELDAMAERADARGADLRRTTQMSARAQAHNDCAEALREAVTRELTKGESGDGDRR